MGAVDGRFIGTPIGTGTGVGAPAEEEGIEMIGARCGTACGTGWLAAGTDLQAGMAGVGIGDAVIAVWEKPFAGTAAVNTIDAIAQADSNRSRKALPLAKVFAAAKNGIQDSRSGALPVQAATSRVRSSRRKGHTVVFAKDSQTCHLKPLT